VGKSGTGQPCSFRAVTLASLSIVEGNPGSETTAYGLLADFINAVKNQVSVGSHQWAGTKEAASVGSKGSK